MRITVVCVCAFLLVVRETRCEDEVPESEEGTSRIDDQGDQKNAKGLLPGT